MTVILLQWSVIAAQIMLLLAMGLAALRMFIGPRAQDRILGMDALYAVTMLQLLVFGIHTGSIFYFEAALIIAILGFSTTVAFSKFLMRGEVIE